MNKREEERQVVVLVVYANVFFLFARFSFLFCFYFSFLFLFLPCTRCCKILRISFDSSKKTTWDHSTLFSQTTWTKCAIFMMLFRYVSALFSLLSSLPLLNFFNLPIGLIGLIALTLLPLLLSPPLSPQKSSQTLGTVRGPPDSWRPKFTDEDKTKCMSLIIGQLSRNLLVRLWLFYFFCLFVLFPSLLF